MQIWSRIFSSLKNTDILLSSAFNENTLHQTNTTVYSCDTRQQVYFLHFFVTNNFFWGGVASNLIILVHVCLLIRWQFVLTLHFICSAYKLQGSNELPNDNGIKFPQHYRVWKIIFFCLSNGHTAGKSLHNLNAVSGQAIFQVRHTRECARLLFWPFNLRYQRQSEKYDVFSTARTNLNLKCQCKDYSGRDMAGNEIHCLSNRNTDYKLQLFIH